MSTTIHKTFKGIHGGFITSERATCLLCFRRMLMVRVLYSLSTMELFSSIALRHGGPFPHLKVLVTFQLSFLSRRPAPANFSVLWQCSSATQCVNAMDKGDVEVPPQCFPRASSKKHANFSQSSCPTSAQNQIIINKDHLFHTCTKLMISDIYSTHLANKRMVDQLTGQISGKVS